MGQPYRGDRPTWKPDRFAALPKPEQLHDANGNLLSAVERPLDLKFQWLVKKLPYHYNCYAPNSERFFSQIAINGFPGSGRVIPAKD
jgi:hypothetical protein